MEGYIIDQKFSKVLNKFERVETRVLKDGRHFLNKPSYKKSGLKNGARLTVKRGDFPVAKL